VIKKSYNCEVCGAERKEANHWFVFTRTAVGLHFRTWNWAVREDALDDDDQGHLCGQGCAHKLLDDFLAQPKKERE